MFGRARLILPHRPEPQHPFSGQTCQMHLRWPLITCTLHVQEHHFALPNVCLIRLSQRRSSRSALQWYGTLSPNVHLLDGRNESRGLPNSLHLAFPMNDTNGDINKGPGRHLRMSEVGPSELFKACIGHCRQGWQTVGLVDNSLQPRLARLKKKLLSRLTWHPTTIIGNPFHSNWWCGRHRHCQCFCFVLKTGCY